MGNKLDLISVDMDMLWAHVAPTSISHPSLRGYAFCCRLVRITFSSHAAPYGDEEEQAAAAAHMGI